MKPIEEVYQYLNFQMQESPLTSRNKSAFALRLLYCFLSLSNKDIHEIDEKIFKQLIVFLKGIDANPTEYSMKTQRSNSTINGYLSIYRSFFEYLNIRCNALYRAKNVYNHQVIDGITSSTERIQYSNNLRTSKQPSWTVPKYISPTDFASIFKVILDNQDIQSKIIVHLMYGYGLRLGEVLGLTIEDIQEVRDNGKNIPTLILRNRISDARFQFAKGLPHVIDPKQYKNSDYRALQSRIAITYSFYEEMLNFLGEHHEFLMEKYPDNYKKTIADLVSTRSEMEENHYLFLNRYGKVLSDQTWNNTLKRYFHLANIPVDIEVRDNNLSHRFRHGFAMFHARFSQKPVDVLALQKLMRHKSITSTMVYFNPTPEDELKIKTEFQEELYAMIPELLKGIE